MAALPPAAGGFLAIPAVPVGGLSWCRMYASTNRIFDKQPDVNFGVLLFSTALFATADAQDLILSKVKALAKHSPVLVLALIFLM